MVTKVFDDGLCCCGLPSVAGVWVVANGKRVLNMASLNFLCIAGDLTIRVHALTVVHQTCPKTPLQWLLAVACTSCQAGCWSGQGLLGWVCREAASIGSFVVVFCVTEACMLGYVPSPS